MAAHDDRLQVEINTIKEDLAEQTFGIASIVVMCMSQGRSFKADYAGQVDNNRVICTRGRAGVGRGELLAHQGLHGVKKVLKRVDDLCQNEATGGLGKESIEATLLREMQKILLKELLEGMLDTDGRRRPSLEHVIAKI
mmetsp:Transcript_23100/g.56944  ORF Transcript_23100/g.56944 Transcript_23100/m.56944 type:complete len:139 (+) Transcript_23100:388-804(+)